MTNNEQFERRMRLVLEGIPSGCKLKGESHVYIDRKRPLSEKIHALADELKKFDLETIFIPPLLREKVFKLPQQNEASPGLSETKPAYE